MRFAAIHLGSSIAKASFSISSNPYDRQLFIQVRVSLHLGSSLLEPIRPFAQKVLSPSAVLGSGGLEPRIWNRKIGPKIKQAHICGNIVKIGWKPHKKPNEAQPRPMKVP
jgi:hypothetical protein